MKNNEFIKVIDNFLSPEYCKELINIYKKLEKFNFTYKRNTVIDKETVVKDSSVAIHEAIYNGYSHDIAGEADIIINFKNLFFGGPYKEYTDKYNVLNNYDRHTIKYLKLQKTIPGEGYHSWHSEDTARNFHKRLFTFTLYLNDIKEGGETEFLYLSQRIKPKTGRLAFFPASFEYAHRGNPPLSGEKYILTGWVEFD
tara:strand:- start:502 stop:1095 length:594 start_codon:yes stop_codon:yes gene_type:complete